MNTTFKEDPLLRTPKIAKRTGLSTVTIINLIKKGELQASKIGRRWYVRESVLDAWLRERFGEVGQQEELRAA